MEILTLLYKYKVYELQFNSQQIYSICTSILKKKPTVFEVVNMCPCIRLMHITLAYTIKYPMTDCFINANLLSEKPSIF